MASPLVSQMKASPTVTRMVETFASPWAQHMLYLMGRTTSFSWIGFLVHNFGLVVCGLYGHLNSVLESSVGIMDSSSVIVITGGTIVLTMFSLRKK